MNFSAVKSITIPEGEVVKITSGNIILWQKKANENIIYPATEHTYTYLYGSYSINEVIELNREVKVGDTYYIYLNDVRYTAKVTTTTAINTDDWAIEMYSEGNSKTKYKMTIYDNISKPLIIKIENVPA